MRLSERLWALLFPRRCPFCGRILNLGDTVCAGCKKGISTQKNPFYLPVDGQKLPCFAPYLYEGPARRAVLDLKYHRANDNALFFAEAIFACLGDRHPDVVVFVPDAKKKHTPLARLAGELALLTGAKRRCLLQKKKGIRRQHDLSMEERKKNVLNAYSCKKGVDLSGKCCLLVDDIVTTGSTLSACAQALLRAGAGQVLLAAAAQTRRTHQEASFGQTA